MSDANMIIAVENCKAPLGPAAFEVVWNDDSASCLFSSTLTSSLLTSAACLLSEKLSREFDSSDRIVIFTRINKNNTEPTTKMSCFSLCKHADLTLNKIYIGDELFWPKTQ